MEALFRMCERHNKTLVRYDFNEPCKGKDQCDREAAYAKSLIRSYVDAGHDVQSASDVARAFQYARGLTDTKVAVAEVNNAQPRLVAPRNSEVIGIKSYHSFRFHKTHMVAWRYYDVGSGIKLQYVGVQYSPSIKLVESFVTCQQITLPEASSTPVCKRVKERQDRKANLLFFCPEPGCSKVCESRDQLEQHCLSENHEYLSAKSSSDLIKLSYMNRINSSMHATRTVFSPVDVGTTSSISQQICLPSVMNLQPGWALPKRANFRYSAKQKKVLMKIFLDGEEGNNKMSAEQAVQHIRTTKKLKVDEYVKVSQVKSLFSR